LSHTVYNATGKRKTAVARVRIFAGTGKIIVNGKEALEYFCRPTSIRLIEQPLELAGLLGSYDIFANIKGGGLSGQAGALQHGISRVLVTMNPELKPVLKRAGLVTRDSRVKERKKYGLAGARRAYQFSKR
jgi:small subunit ribosomal protein S9